MTIRKTACPVIGSPCQQLPTFAKEQKLAFCGLCQKNVHNFSALSRREQREVLRADTACIRYARIVPAVALAMSLSHGALAQDADDQTQMEEVEVIGGGFARAPQEVVFVASELDDEAWLEGEDTGESSKEDQP